jgi:hypothetical protein
MAGNKRISSDSCARRGLLQPRFTAEEELPGTSVAEGLPRTDHATAHTRVRQHPACPPIECCDHIMTGALAAALQAGDLAGVLDLQVAHGLSAGTALAPRHAS